MRTIIAVAIWLGAMPAVAQDSLNMEARRYRAELGSSSADLSPGYEAHYQTELNRIERMQDKDEARRQLKSLESDTAYTRSGLVGNYDSLMGPRDGRPSGYAPSDAISAPERWRLPEPGAGWR